MANEYNLIVIGAGPGGYTAAIKAAKLGLSVAVVENRDVGGTCLNRGCIPTKAMIHASSLYQEMLEGSKFGVYAENVTFNYNEILNYKDETTQTLRSGVEQLFKANGVTLYRGLACLKKDRTILIKGEEDVVLSSDNIILATGSKPMSIPIKGIDLPNVLDSDKLFEFDEVPESLLIIGGGVISVEFATVFQALGCKVTIVEALPRILPNMDKEISQNLKMILKKRGVDIHTAAAVKLIEETSDGLKCTFTEKDKDINIEATYILSAVGRVPNTEGLFEEEGILEMERGRVIVDDDFKTSMDHVYAIGDLIPGIQLAHVASAQGICIAERIAGEEPTIDLSVVPGCVYTNPEIASVGITQDEAKEKGINVKVGKFVMSANGKSLISKEERGFVKIVSNEATDVILGMQMMCANATDMIGEGATAIANQMTSSDLLRAMRAHPTYNEGVGEALEELEGGAIHIAPRKKL